MQNRLKWKTQIVHLNQQAVKLSFSTEGPSHKGILAQKLLDDKEKEIQTLK